MKKIVTLLLTVVVLCGLLSVVALADGSAALSVVPAANEANPGDEITVAVNLSGNPGVKAIQFTVNYDASALEYVSHSIKQSGMSSFNASTMSYGWMSTAVDSYSGTVMEITFKVLDKLGATNISLSGLKFGISAKDQLPCDTVSGTVTVACANHDYSVEKLVSEATCKGAAVYEKTCSICGASNGETYTKGEALPHTEKDLAAVAPTCTETGLTAGKVCEVCGFEIVKQETVPATGHKGGTATCAEKAKCDVCGVAYGEFDKENHPADALVTEGAKDATCTEDGSTGIGKCNACGTEFDKATVIPAKGHSFGEYTVTKEATCTEKGEETATCSVCGEKDTKEIDKVPHDYKETNRVEATCDTEGYIESKCSVCGADTAKILPALGHKWGEWKVTVEATKTEKGEKVRVCEVCQETETKEIPATGSVAPKTGDEANIALYAVMFVMAGAAVVALSTKKKEN